MSRQANSFSRQASLFSRQASLFSRAASLFSRAANRPSRRHAASGLLSVWVGVMVAITLALGAVLASRWMGSLTGSRHLEQTFWQHSLAESAAHLALAHINASDTYAGATTAAMTVAVTKPKQAPPLTSPWTDLAAYHGDDWRQIRISLPAGGAWLATAKAQYDPLFRTLLDARERIELQEVATASFDSEVPDAKDPRGGERPQWGDLIGGQISLRAVQPRNIGGRLLTGSTGRPVLDPGISVSGEQRALSRPWPRASMPPVQGAFLPIPTDKQQVLPGGHYRTSGLYLQGQGRFIFQSPTALHIEGNVVIGPQMLVGPTHRASDLLLLVSGSACEIHLPFSGGVFAPDAEVTLHGTGDFVGAIVARAVRNDGQGRLLFDRALPRWTRGERQFFRLVHIAPALDAGDAMPSDGAASDVPAGVTAGR
ncbi:MAG: hypothetical protein H7338_09330 [Candidatus Sericytochromatia bacterium]|nr:hypothetical protein [Candidatus Sericytochromatia bacterium]